MNVCFIMYPWDTIKAPEDDSTLAMLQEFAKRGHGVVMTTPANLTIRESVAYGFCNVLKRMDKVPSNLKSFHSKATFKKEMLRWCPLMLSCIRCSFCWAWNE